MLTIKEIVSMYIKNISVSNGREEKNDSKKKKNQRN